MNPEQTLEIIAEIVQAHEELYVALDNWLNVHSEGTSRELSEAIAKSKRLIEAGEGGRSGCGAGERLEVERTTVAMTTLCMPAETAENGSLHWVESPTGPRQFSVRVLVWDAHQELFQNTENYRYVSTIGWRYIGPASPNDAAALAEARAEIAARDAALDKAACELNGAVEEAVALRAQVAALTEESLKMRAAMKWVYQVRPATLQDGGARVEMTWEEFNAMRIATGLLAQIPSKRARAALAKPIGGEVGDV